MPSPFPGMDPYLERNWRDVHGSLIAESRRALNHQLPKGLFARMEERVGLETLPEDGDNRGHLDPDVRAVSRDVRRRTGGGWLRWTRRSDCCP